MASDLNHTKLSSPRIFLIRMLVFLILCGLIAFVLQRQIFNAFLANPWLNGLIIGVLLIGIILSFHHVIRLFPEVAWVNGFRSADPKLAAKREPKMLAPMAAMLGGERVDRVVISPQTMRAFLDSLATRLDEARDISRYLTGLLVFLGLLGTFWGLIETVGSVGGIINGLKIGGDADTVFETLKEGLAAPGVGAANGGAALPAGIVDAFERLRHSVEDGGAGKATTTAMANLAEAIQGLVQHMRSEQQMIRDWADEQAKLNRDLRHFMERVAREGVER